MASSWHPFCPYPPLCPCPTQTQSVCRPPLRHGYLYSKLSCYLRMEGGLFSSLQCQVASQAAFLPSQLAFLVPQVSLVRRREGRRGKVDLQQLSGQSGPGVDGLWASSPVWVCPLKKKKREQNKGYSVSKDIDSLYRSRHLKTTVRKDITDKFLLMISCNFSLQISI